MDASAVLAVLRRERGADIVQQHVRGSLISSVNLAEIFYKTDADGADRERVERALMNMQLLEIPFGRDQAEIVASIYPMTIGSSVGFADRACLALAKSHGIPALTGDHDWLKHDIGVEVLLFRKRAVA